MIRFDVIEAKNVLQGCSLLAEHREEAKVIAGGQNLVVLLRRRLITPRYVVSIKRCTDMEYIMEDRDGLKLGALTTHRAIEKSALIQKKLPMLAELERELGCVQTRNWGTIGGNLCQASPSNDLAPALIALGACCKVKSVRGERIIPLDGFFVGYQKTALEPDEILVEIQVPKPLPHTGGVYRKETVRFADPPIASVAVVITLGDQGIVESVRILLQAVMVTPLRARKAEKLIAGEWINDKLLDAAAASAAEEAKPISDVYGSANYKREMIKVLTKHNIKEAIRRAQVA